MMQEYLRRNLLVAQAEGAKAGVSKSLKRLEQMSRPPKWLVKSLQGVLQRVDPLPHELATWRNAAPDAPSYVRPAAETESSLGDGVPDDKRQHPPGPKQPPRVPGEKEWG